MEPVQHVSPDAEASAFWLEITLDSCPGPLIARGRDRNLSESLVSRFRLALLSSKVNSIMKPKAACFEREGIGGYFLNPGSFDKRGASPHKIKRNEN
jgi:hypothetical protein